jgi:hypothetical protein
MEAQRLFYDKYYSISAYGTNLEEPVVTPSITATEATPK